MVRELSRLQRQSYGKKNGVEMEKSTKKMDNITIIITTFVKPNINLKIQ